MQALEDLTYERRKDFLRKYHLPEELPVVSFHTEASISPAVLATLSCVAHAEMPMFPPLSAGHTATLPVVMPLGAAISVCSQGLQIRYGEKSDVLVTCRDAEVPDSVVVRPKRKLDHAWMVYLSMNNHLRRIGVVSYYTEKNHVFRPCQKNLLIKYMINANIHPEKMASLSCGDAVEGKGKDMASHLFQELNLRMKQTTPSLKNILANERK
ncbi:Uncharacterized protein Fot_23022 [Forsythia ovata]|uniref:Uncharacterized protein n=1 Tax=Forsythia ovata TaxID=205694 RepID=A0ABD1UZR1_9LAMI